MWSPELERVSGPMYLAISEALRRDIASGRLRPGEQLPPQRQLAGALGIDLGTVTRAYAEARRLGLITADGRRGSSVRGAAGPVADQVQPYETGMNLPPLPLHSSLPDCLAAAMQEILAGPTAGNRLQYQPTGGAAEDRRAGVDWLALRGIEAQEDTVLVVSGGQTALHAIAHSALDPGDAVCTGPFVYPGWLAVARRRGLALIPLDSDEQGILPQALDRACRAGAVRAVYLVPHNDNPTAATMGEERRRAVVDLAREHDLLIIEDDAYGFLAETPLPPLAGMAPERTWHVASLSKIISPALRVAYLRAPAIRDMLRLTSDVHETTIMAPPLNVAAATRWLRSGTWMQLVGEVRAECVARQALVAEGLPSASYRASPDGYHLWVPLSGGMSSADAVAALAATGLSIVPGEAFAVKPSGAGPALRISIGGGLTRERLARAVQHLDALLHHQDGRSVPMV